MSEALPLAHVRAVLFDLDGTLADTAPDLAYALNVQRRRQGHTELPLSRLRPHVSEGARGMLRAGLGITPEHPEYVQLRSQFLQIYADNICRESSLFPGMAELLMQLEGRGLAWGIVTNKQTVYTHPLLTQLRLLDRAACVVCGDTTAHAKPHPAPLLEASRVLSIEPQHCVYVGDDERDVIAAHAAGMTPVVALYGYLGELKPPQQWGANLYISAPLDLLNMLALPLSMG
jgi:phosphoglycolate phosphatase